MQSELVHKDVSDTDEDDSEVDVFENVKKFFAPRGQYDSGFVTIRNDLLRNLEEVRDL